MSTSGRDGEPSGGTGSNVLVEEVVCEAQAGPSAQAQKDRPSNSGEHCIIPSSFGTNTLQIRR